MIGQVVRMVQYDRAANERNAITGLKFEDDELHWYRLDDGVMGGKSETSHVMEELGGLHFKGNLNTKGGGFATVRTWLPDNFKAEKGIKIRIRGDGKTYCFFLCDESLGGPFSKRPTWQMDIPTTSDEKTLEVDIPFDKLLPIFGSNSADPDKYTFNVNDMRQMGFSLAITLSDGSPNPKETFGDGEFPFSLHIESIEPLD